MKRFLTIVSLLTLMSFSAKADDIKIAELNWQSGSMIANIDAYILKHGYGHNVEIVPGGIDATIQSMMATGEPNIFGEAWTSLLGDGAKDYIKRGLLIQVRDEVVVGAGEGFYIPDYIALEYGFTTIEQVLERPDLFPHPEDSSKGGIVICPEGWSCLKHNNNLFRAFDMEAKGWKTIDPGSGTGLNSAWEGAVAKEQPFVGYYWEPTSFVGKLGLVKLGADVGYAGDDNWTNCISLAVEECENPQPSAWPTSATGTIITPSIQLNKDVVDYLSKRSIDGKVVTAMLVWFDDNQATAEDAAVEFLKQYPLLWSKWVTPEVAEKLTTELTKDLLD